jgi:hypothetical protein
MKGQERLSSEQPFDPLSYRKTAPADTLDISSS